MLIFEEGRIGDLTLKNRVILPPMCMYSADEEGNPQDFHLVHYGAIAMGGVGLVIVEATGVRPEGRISQNDLGIWQDEQISGHKKLVEVIHGFDAKAGIQLAHAGRKCEAPGMDVVAPSALQFSSDYRLPREMTPEDIQDVKEAFVAGAKRALLAGYDLLELHGAHGYLLHEFLSPLTNHRQDDYGGSRENRVRLIREIATAIQAIKPKEVPMILRVSATDSKAGGIDIEEMVEIVNLLKDCFDAFHISSGGLVPDATMKIFPGYQVAFAQTIKERCQVPTIAVGLITGLEQMEDILGNGRADFVALGRLLLRKPFYLLNLEEEAVPIPKQLERGFPHLKYKKVKKDRR